MFKECLKLNASSYKDEILILELTGMFLKM